jgi:hypothetical protein
MPIFTVAILFPENQCCNQHPDLHHFGKLGQDLNTQPHQSEKQDPDPHLHHSEKVEVIEVILGALEITYLGKSEWWDPDLDPDPHQN